MVMKGQRYCHFCGEGQAGAVVLDAAADAGTDVDDDPPEKPLAARRSGPGEPDSPETMRVKLRGDIGVLEIGSGRKRVARALGVRPEDVAVKPPRRILSVINAGGGGVDNVTDAMAKDVLPLMFDSMTKPKKRKVRK